MNGHIVCTIDQSFAQDLLLSSLVGNIVSPTLLVQITLSQHVVATVIDDLEDYASDCTLEFLLQERSQLILKMRSVNAPSAKEVSRNLIVRLVGEHAQATVRYACLGTGDKKFKIISLQEHQAEHGTSHVVVRSVLDDNAKMFCKGLIHIQKGAQHTHAELENKNVLLGQGSRAVSIPTLEIEANDVVCKHGAAISKLDAEQFFYLQSRGITVPQARTMLIESFLTL